MEKTAGVSRHLAESTGFWLTKIVTGFLVIVLLCVHFIVNHFSPDGKLLTWDGVVTYFSNPFVVAMEITFLVVVVTHALIGVRSIILDFNPAGRLMEVLNKTLVIIWAGTISYGIWLALKIYSFS